MRTDAVPQLAALLFAASGHWPSLLSIPPILLQCCLPLHYSLVSQAQVSPEAEGDLGVPQIVGSYHTLYPLEDVTAETTSQVRLPRAVDGGGAFRARSPPACSVAVIV